MPVELITLVGVVTDSASKLIELVRFVTDSASKLIELVVRSSNGSHLTSVTQQLLSLQSRERARSQHRLLVCGRKQLCNVGENF